jgi:hypothetical protein
MGEKLRSTVGPIDNGDLMGDALGVLPIGTGTSNVDVMMGDEDGATIEAVGIWLTGGLMGNTHGAAIGAVGFVVTGLLGVLLISICTRDVGIMMGDEDGATNGSWHLADWRLSGCNTWGGYWCSWLWHDWGCTGT